MLYGKYFLKNCMYHELLNRKDAIKKQEIF